MNKYGFGRVKYIGIVQKNPNEVVFGIELEKKIGKNNGRIGGRRYFECGSDRGIFVTRDQIL